MLKYVIILFVATVLMQQIHTFKVVTIQKGFAVAPPAAPAEPPAPAAPAIDPAALLQGVQSAIAGKLKQVQVLAGSLLKQKTALTQNALNSIQSTLGTVKTQVSSLAGNVHTPLVIRKRVYVGVAKPAIVPVPVPGPEVTTTIDSDATTTSG